MWSPFFGSDSRLELNIYSNQLAFDVGEADEIILSQNKLDVQKGNEKVTYQLISGSMRRYVDGRGYVPMLESVKSFSCESENHKVTCETELNSGVIHRRTLSSMRSKVGDM